MKKYAVIVAGGSGLRMGAAIPKQFLSLSGRPVLWHTLEAFLAAFDDLHVILVLPQTYLEEGQVIARMTSSPGRIHTTAGGATRFASVKNGLQHVPEQAIVFVHDGVRCLITPTLVRHCYTVAVDKGNAIPAVTAVDSMRVATAEGNQPIDRSTVRIIQTPQTFLSSVLKKAFEQEYYDAFTDEAGVAERAGVKIHLVKGEETNIKITNPVDLLLAEKILEEREKRND